jgi:hypothetical protein
LGQKRVAWPAETGFQGEAAFQLKGP